IYGVNTNVGALLKEKRKEKNEIELIREHALSKEMFEENDIARATLLVLLNQLALGYSTISPNTYNFLLNFFNSGEKLLFSKIGSLGASGDLIPLANLSLSIIESSSKSGNFKKEIELEQGDAIALINSTAHSCASLSFSLVELMELLDISCMNVAFSTEVLRARTSHFEINALKVKKHTEQIIVGNYILKLLEGSELTNKSPEIQEAYTLRCVPQVYGAIKRVLDFTNSCLIQEMNSYSGNPVIDFENQEIYYGGNFHAELLSLCADLLRSAIASWGNMIERRINRLLNPNLNRGLPPFLGKDGSIGLMICQYLAAYHVNELRILATPSCAVSISTSADQEDFVSMAGNAVNILRDAINHLKILLAIELLCNIEAAKFLEYEKKGGKLKEIYKSILRKISQEKDIRDKIETIKNSLEEICKELRSSFGSLFVE
ncbi:MAG TPA: aromatic amino acid ammonia-lyase, partial [Geobacterales bacterium]|nr:aromatic amino acid ammonia-lyase [Geobacterales bacterium]